MQSSGAIDRRRLIAWLAAIAACGANLFLHLWISNLCDLLYRRIGRVAYEWLTLTAIGALSLGVAALLLRHRLKLLARPAAVRIGTALLVLTVGAQQTLLVTNVELIHYPQFALLAVLLLMAGLRPVPAFLVTTLMGIGDEAYQHAVTYRGVPNTYLDFNDMVLNAIGAAWTVTLAAATTRSGADESWKRPPTWIVCLFGAAILLLGWIDPPKLSPFFSPALTGRPYHVMGAAEGLLALALLYFLVTRIAGPESEPDARCSKVLASQAFLVLLALWSVGCVASPPLGSPSDGRTVATLEPATERPDFVVTFWCGPPLSEMNDVRAAEIAEAGFNVIGAPCEGVVTPELNRRALDVAARHGLAVTIADRRIDGCLVSAPDCGARLAEMVADFASHPALAGYFIMDEPSADEFESVAAVVERLRRLDPAHPAYVNLLPDFMPPQALKIASYEEYVTRFVRVVAPRLLSYDYYPFKQGEDRGTFFANLWTIRAEARRAGVEFMLIVQAMPHGKYRDPTEAELSWQVFHALAFGARGISYFAYWTPVRVRDAERWKFRYGLIEDGKPTLHYFQALRINRAARAIAAELASFRPLAVGDSHGEIGVAPPLGPIETIEGGAITAGLFRDDGGRLAVLLVNRDYRYGVDAALRLSPGAAWPSVFDPATRRWSIAERLELDLPPGGARLLSFDEGA